MVELVLIHDCCLSPSRLQEGKLADKPTSGFLTLDQYRNVVCLDETDPFASKLPLVGM